MRTGSTVGNANLAGNSAGDAAFPFCVASAGSFTFDSCDATFDTWLRIFTTGLRDEVASCEVHGPVQGRR